MPEEDEELILYLSVLRDRRQVLVNSLEGVDREIDRVEQERKNLKIAKQEARREKREAKQQESAEPTPRKKIK